MLKLFKILEEADSPYNGKIQVVRTLEGVRILAGGVSQSGWIVKSIWDTALKKVREDRPELQDVLILGLGGGSAAELVAGYWPQARTVGVDIDPVMIDLGKKYLHLGDIPNLEIVEADAEKWVSRGHPELASGSDLVLVDLYQGSKIPKQFTSNTFIKKIENLLRPGSVAAFNHFYSWYEKEDAHKLGGRLRRIFPVVREIYPEANVVFLCYKN